MKRLLFALLAALTFVLPAVAQEATPVPEATATAPDTTTVIAENGATVNIDAPETSNVSTLINLVIVIIAAIVGGGSFALIWSRIRTSKEAKDNLERLYEGLSPTWQPTIERTLKIAEELIIFAREVTDHKENLPPPAQTTGSNYSEPHR